MILQLKVFFLSLDLHSSGKTHNDRLQIVLVKSLKIKWNFLSKLLSKINKKKICPQLHEDWTSMFILNGNIGTDIFFLLSGLLLAYTLMAKCKDETDVSLNFPSLFLNRFVR